MEAAHLFVLLIVFFTLGFGIILGSSTRQDTMAHWDERRCDLDVLMSAFMYKPDSDTRGVGDFSADNFNFCIGAKAESYLKSIFGMLFEVMKNQMGVASILSSAMQTLRAGLNDIYAPFSTMMNKFFNKFKQIGSLASISFQQLYMAMKKASGAAVASMYIAISLQVAFMNGIDLVIKIIMIVLYILLALAFIFFIPLIPVMVFVIMALVGIEKAFPGRTGDMNTVFCFAPDTLIYMKDGQEAKIQNIVLGDVLQNGATVEAVVELPASRTDTLYDIYGVYVSGGHRIWSYTKGGFISVKDHPCAFRSHVKSGTVWTLITSNREIPVRGVYGLVRFADWEEMPSTLYSRMAWERIVRGILNSPYNAFIVPHDAPCLDKSMLVVKYQGGLVPLSSIVRGDWILDDNGWTRVIGLCNREVQGGIGDKGSRMTDGVWIRSKNGIWEHPRGVSDSWKWRGLQLITESGCFYAGEYLVRDFTEVGVSKLSESYVREDEVMK